MEAVPRLPMISFDFKISPQRPDFTSKLRQLIRERYGEDPDMYMNEIYELENLRPAVSRELSEFTECATLKRYYCQLHSLSNRFPLQGDSPTSISFVWCDLFTDVETSRSNIDFEMASILYNIGALHTRLGANDNRADAEGMKVACSHFQCAAWAFQHLREKYSHLKMTDLSGELLDFMSHVCLAQAQECILEKSMIDHRKSLITAKVTVQIVDYYKQALRSLLSLEDPNSTLPGFHAGGHQQKEWEIKIQLRMHYLTAVGYLYQGMHAEEKQQMGVRITYYQAAQDKLNAAFKAAKEFDKARGKVILETLRFTNDVITGKLTSSQKDNEFVYHEKVPALETIPDLKGASLVKGVSFDVHDADVAGHDIFSKLVPIEAHEAASLYSEEKAKILRDIAARVEESNNELQIFMASLQLEHLDMQDQPERLPQELVDRVAAMSANPNAVEDLVSNMNDLSKMCKQVETALDEIKLSFKNEEENEKVYQAVTGKRPPSMVISELAREAARCEETHAKADESNKALTRAISSQMDNIKLLTQPLSHIQNVLPSTKVEQTPEEMKSRNELNRLRGKVEEMRSQRSRLEEELRDSLQNDDITRRLVTNADKPQDELFRQELSKHDHKIQILEQNLAAQNNILRALTEAHAQYAETKKKMGDALNERELAIDTLIRSHMTYQDLVGKLAKGQEFYQKLQQNVQKLVQRVRSVCKVQEEERDTVMIKHKYVAPSAPAEVKGPTLGDYLKAGYRATPAGRQHAGLSNGSSGQTNVPAADPHATGSLNNSPSHTAHVNNVAVTQPSTNAQAYTGTGYQLYAYQQGPGAAVTDHGYGQSHVVAPYSHTVTYSHPWQTQTQAYTYPTASPKQSQTYASQQYPPQTKPQEYPYSSQYQASTGSSSSTVTLPSSNQTATTIPAYSTSRPPFTSPNHPSASSYVDPSRAAGISYTVLSQPSISSYSAPSQPSYTTPSQHSITSNAVASQFSMPPYTTPSQPSMSYTAAVQPSMPSHATAGQHSMPSYTASRQPSVPSYTASGQPSVIPSYIASGKPSIPSYTDADQPLMPSHAATSQLSMPSYTAAGQPSIPSYTVAGQPSMPSYTTADQPSISSHASVGQPSMPSYTAAGQPSMPSYTAAGQPSMPSYTAAGQPSMPSYTAAGQLSMPSYTAAGHSSMPSYTVAGQPAMPSYTAAGHPSMPSYTAAGHPSMPSYTAAGHPSMPSYTAASHPSMPSYTAASHPSMPSYTAAGHPSTPSYTTANHPSMPSYTAANHPSMPSYTVGVQPSVPSYTTASQPSMPTYTVANQASVPSQATVSHPSMPSYTAANQASYIPPSQSVPNQTSYTSQPSYSTTNQTPIRPYIYTQPSGMTTIFQQYSNNGMYYQQNQKPYNGAYSQGAICTQASHPVCGPYASSSTVYSQAGYYNPSQQTPYNSGQTYNGVAPQNHTYTSYSAKQPYMYPNYHQPSSVKPQVASQSPQHSSTSSPAKTATPSSQSPVHSNSVPLSNVDLLSGIQYNPDQGAADKRVPFTKQNSSDLLSESGSPTPSGRGTPILQPKILTASDIQRQKEEQAKASMLQTSKDPFVDSEELKRFASEVESFEKVVEELNVKNLSGQSPLDQRWNELIDQQEQECRKLSISVARCYPMKNKCADILPYDYSRVDLPETKDDYINASHVKELSMYAPEFIVTQTPLSSTISDFWAMVWSQGVETILCMLPPDETSPQYWPSEKGEGATYGQFKIALQSTKPSSSWIERILSLTHQQSQQGRVIVHLQFLDWPHSTVIPANPSSLLHLVSEVLGYHKQQRFLLHPIVVHCLAGVGRSGVLLLLTVAVALMKSGQLLQEPVPIAVNMSKQRRSLIQTKEQLGFCYKAILHHAQDILIQRGIGSEREELDVAVSSHRRTSSSDFILSQGGLNTLQTGLAKLGLDKQYPLMPIQPVAALVDKVEEPIPPSDTPKTMAAELTAHLPPHLAKSLDPAQFSLGPLPEPKANTFTQQRSLKDNPDPNDPLSQLDPLWTMKK